MQVFVGLRTNLDIEVYDKKPCFCISLVRDDRIEGINSLRFFLAVKVEHKFNGLGHRWFPW